MIVHVCVPSLRKTISFEGSPSDKVLSVKLGLVSEEELADIPVENIRLTLTSSSTIRLSRNSFPQLESTILEDDHPVSEYTSTGSLFLQLKLLKPIYVKTSEGEKFKLRIEENDTVEYIKKTIESTRGIPVDRQELSFVDPAWESDDGKDAQPIVLQEGRSMFHYCPPKGYIMYVKILVNILVKTAGGKEMRIGIHPSDIIYDIHQRIQERERILIPNQLLSIEGQLQENGLTKALEYNSTVSSSNIQDGTVLRLGVAQKIVIVTPEGKKWRQKVFSSDTTLDLKARIYCRFQIPIENQILMFCEEELEPGQTLAEQNILRGATITVIRSIGNRNRDD